MYATIEAGGTKFVVGIIDLNDNIISRVSVKTETPEITLKNVANILKEYDIIAIGIGSFGPIDLNLNSDTYGYITTTPKKNWEKVNIVGYFKNQFDVPIGFDTDVNAAALAEFNLGGAKDVDSCVYLTVGTGIGGGVIINGKMVHGLSHPEVGHMNIIRHKDDLDFKSVCSYHENCAEGLASGPSILSRVGVSAEELKPDHLLWEIESYYLAQVIVNLILTLSIEKVILGGGVMHQLHLIPMIKKDVEKLLNGYIDLNLFGDDFIITPKLLDNAGILGALELAKKSIKN